jgi:three-Cys-motif partner protein
VVEHAFHQRRAVTPKKRSHGGGAEPFFARRFEWSVWKHLVLAKYLQIWVYKLGSAHPRLAFVDTNAGAGLYDDGSKGSPLLAAEWNGRQVGDHFAHVDVYACEVEADEASKLRRALTHWMGLTPPRAFVYESPFWEVLPEIFEATRAVPSLFFIDPFSVTDIGFDKLEPLLHDRKRASTEVLVRVDPVMFARMAGWAQDRTRPEKSSRAAESFKRLLTKFNIDGDAIADAMRSGSEPAKAELFANYLELFERRFKWVQAIPIRPTYWSAPKYYLVHGTDSAHGAALINDAVSTNEDSLYADTVADDETRVGQYALFPAERSPRSSLRELRDAALKLVQASPMRSIVFIELRAQLVKAFGPEFREKHHKAAVRALIEANSLSIAAGDRLLDGSMLRAI